MENINLASENAYVPNDNESPHQPEVENNMVPPTTDGGKPRRKLMISFEETDYLESSQKSSQTYNEALSQPASSLTHRQRLEWIQKHRNTGLWAQCDDCDKWRYLPHILDSSELPKKWYCRMNVDRKLADCSTPEVEIRLHEEEDLIHSEYAAGSVVWARIPGWPWWPAMVDDCPDTEQYYWLDGFSDIPTHYNVVFFDTQEPTRAWIAPNNLLPYRANKKSIMNSLKEKRYKKRIEISAQQADDADSLPLKNRLAKYSFIVRYNGTIGNPKKVTKKDLKKHQKQLKRKFNIAFPIESPVPTDNEDDEVQVVRKNNVILLGTPKSGKRAHVPKKIRIDDNVEITELEKNVNDTVNIQEADSSQADTSNKEETAADCNITKPNLEAPFEGNKNNNWKEPENTLKNSTEIPSETLSSALVNGLNTKQPDSMQVYMGSTLDLATIAGFDSAGMDNDTSSTYIPESQTDPITQSSFPDIEIRIASPSSDDFDF